MIQPTLIAPTARALFSAQFAVIGEPVGQPRIRSQIITPKGGRGGGRPFVHHYTPKTIDPWKNSIGIVALSKRPPAPLTGPVRVDLTFYFSRPQRLLKKSSPQGYIPHTSKPDRDNLDKPVLDALKAARFFEDDDQVFAGQISKWYVKIEGGVATKPGVLIEVYDMSPPEGSDLFPKEER